MIIPVKLLKHLHEVPVETIEEAINMLPDSRAFQILLEDFAEFKKANTEPVILANADQSAMTVSSRETMYSNKLH